MRALLMAMQHQELQAAVKRKIADDGDASTDSPAKKAAGWKPRFHRFVCSMLFKVCTILNRDGNGDGKETIAEEVRFVSAPASVRDSISATLSTSWIISGPVRCRFLSAFFC